VIGNPPFLGDKKMRAELGDGYTTTLRKVYEGRVPGGADLVCYWFEKARTAIETNGLGAAGLVSTSVITRGANRQVLDRVCETKRIYEAWERPTLGQRRRSFAGVIGCVWTCKARHKQLDGHNATSNSPDL
ncbi:MAG: hypothetical protein IPG23_10240, partial [Burkholderiales bacterium]|nr:hypothetical protein [Burkholderiales bacterium]